MKIEFKITPRDKKLLWLLGICIFLLAFYYIGIKPVSGRISELENRKELLLLQQMEMEQKIAKKETYEQLSRKNREQLQQLEAKFLALQSSEQLDRHLTAIFIGQDMVMQDSTLRTAQLVDIAPYRLSSRMKKYRADNQTNEYEDDIQSTETAIEAEADLSMAGQPEEGGTVALSTQNVYSVSASYTALGTKEQALAVLDALAEETGIRVDSFSISEVSQQVGTGDQVTYQTKQRLEVNLVVYMCAAE